MGSWVIAIVIGAIYGIAGTIGQSGTLGVIPAGLIIAVVGVAALLFAVRVLTGDRWATLATGMGAMLTTMLFSGKGPGGSVVVPAPADGQLSTGLIWTIAVPVLVAIIVAWPSRIDMTPTAKN